MRLYLIAPVVPSDADEKALDARLIECIEPIADLILAHVAGDPALFAVRHCNEVSEPPLPPTGTYSYANVAEISDTATLRTVLKETLDPFSGKWSLVRSLVTCRAIAFGYDGQALVCLPTDDVAVESPDPSLISVEDISQMLLETDHMDGLLDG